MNPLASRGPEQSGVPFRDRADAGRALARELKAKALKAPLQRPVVVALARGGVLVGAEIARSIVAPLVAMPVGKVGAPGQEELAIGAVAPGGVTVLNNDVISLLGLSEMEVEALVGRASAKVAAEWRAYRGGRQVPLASRAAIVVDDGLATGATMRAALEAVRRQRPSRLVMAVAVAPPDALAALAPMVDEYVCAVQARHMRAVGAWYEDFTQTTDEEVTEALDELGLRA